MGSADRRRYVLADFAIERRDTGWFFGPLLDPARTYRGPYASVASVTLMVARQLRKELERRDHRAPTGNGTGDHDRPPF